MSSSSITKLNLITRNLGEVLHQDKLEEVLKTRNLKIYWGTAPTGRPHIAYFVPLMKIADFLQADCQVTILLADLHAYLDNMKAPWDRLKLRTSYYEQVIKACLVGMGVSIEKLKFVVGTSYQLTEKYNLDAYRLAAISSIHDSKKAGAQVVKQVEHPMLSSLIYPGLQALDEEYLDVDAQFGGIDQRKIFVYAEKYLPLLGYSKRAHLMNTMVPGLTGDKMSSSVEESKIDILDSPSEVEKKIKKAFCEEGNVDNGLLPFCKVVLFPFTGLLKEMNNPPAHGSTLLPGQFVIQRPPKFGGDLVYSQYDALESDFINKLLHPGDLKQGIINAVVQLLKPVQASLQSKAFQLLANQAYPSKLSKHDKAEMKSKKKLVVVKNKKEDISRLDIKVGFVVDCKQHPDADGLYISKICVEEGCSGDMSSWPTRTIVSGLAQFVPLVALKHSKVLVLSNLKTSKLRGVESEGMVLCASNEDHTVVEIVRPNENAAVGSLVKVSKYALESEGMVNDVVNPKSKTYPKIMQGMKLDAEGCAIYEGEHGVDYWLINGMKCTTNTLKSCRIS